MTMASSSIDKIHAAGADAKAAQKPSNELDGNAFLKLLTAQLGNQDPTKPVDSHEFVAQLAQFTSVELLQSLGGKLDSMLLAQAGANQTAVASLVGRDITYRTNQLQLEAEGGVPIGFDLQGEATEVTIVIRDSSGKTVRTIRLGAHDAGNGSTEWDGRAEDGTRLPPGDYTAEVVAQDGKDKVETSTTATGRATGVSFEEGVPQLIVNGERVRLGDVVEIEEAAN